MGRILDTIHDLKMQTESKGAAPTTVFVGRGLLDELGAEVCAKTGMPPGSLVKYLEGLLVEPSETLSAYRILVGKKGDTRCASHTFLPPAGLEGALVGEAPTAVVTTPGPTHLHGVVVLAPGENPSVRCGGCRYERGGGPDSFYAADRSVKPGTMRLPAEPLAWPMATEPPDSLDALPLEAKKQLSQLNRDYDDGKISFGQAVKEATAIIAPTIARLTGKIAAAQIEACRPRWSIPRNPKPEPWQPSVDEFDLLPDA